MNKPAPPAHVGQAARILQSPKASPALKKSASKTMQQQKKK